MRVSVGLVLCPSRKECGGHTLTSVRATCFHGKVQLPGPLPPSASRTVTHPLCFSTI